MIYEFDPFRLDISKRLLMRGEEEPVPLTPKVFDTLLYLVRNAGKVIGKDELMREIWADSIVEENNLNQNISILRRIFGEKPGEQRFIVTVAGHGYRFVPEVRSVSTEEINTPDAADGNEDLADSTPGPAPAEQISNSRHVIVRIEDRPRVVAIASIILAALIVAGSYFWKGEGGPVGAIRNVAVLPFKPLVVENRNEALELGMADALISKLSAGENMVVRPLSSVRRFNSVDQDAVTTGRDLGVDSVLDGTIQNWGDRIRVSAKLIRISDGKQLWGEQFDENFTDIFVVQDSISRKVAEALKLQLSGNDKKRQTENFEAYQLYMKGRYNIAKGTPPDLIASIPFFEEAIRIDPGYALAYTGLANAYGVLGLAGDTTIPDTVSRSRVAERKALEIDHTLGDAQIAHCMGLFWYDWDWLAAEKACVKAIEIDPNNSDFHGHYAMLLSSTGRHAEALAEVKRSLELNPLNLTQSAIEGQFLLHAGRIDESLAKLKKTSELEPNFWMPHFYAASAYIEKGMFGDALAESQKASELSGQNVMLLGTYALARSGRKEEARKELNTLLDPSGTKSGSAYSVALVYSALDEPAKTFEWLEKGFEHRDPLMTFLKVEPKWNRLRGDARFIQLMKRMNLF